MKITKVLSTIMSAVICTSCFTYTANSKVIEPEIVKTETWTTSYYIDDDVETLYPYIQCEADIYNDGTIKLYMWNTHEWDGFAIFCHRVTFVSTFPYSSSGIIYNAVYGKDDRYSFGMPNNVIIDISYYPSYYTIDDNMPESPKIVRPYIYDCIFGENFDTLTKQVGSATYKNNNETISEGIYVPCVSLPLPNIPTYNSRPIAENYCYTFTPDSEYVFSKKQINFRLFGHDITITPELLSGNITAEPELTDQEKYIKQLEEENAKLKEEVNSYKSLDSDSDGMLTVNDAQMILNYYVEYMSGNVSGKVEDYQKFIENFKETS